MLCVVEDLQLCSRDMLQATTDAVVEEQHFQCQEPIEFVRFLRSMFQFAGLSLVILHEER